MRTISQKMRYAEVQLSTVPFSFLFFFFHFLHFNLLICLFLARCLTLCVPIFLYCVNIICVLSVGPLICIIFSILFERFISRASSFRAANASSILLSIHIRALYFSPPPSPLPSLSLSLFLTFSFA